MCPLRKRPILMSHYAICLKVCLECCRGCGGHKRKHLSLTRERGPRDLSFRTSGGLNSGGEEGGVGGGSPPPSPQPPASHHPSPWGFKTERERRICLPGVFPSGAMRLARALRLCAPMHISCIVSFESGVRSPSILHLFVFFLCSGFTHLTPPSHAFVYNIASGGSRRVRRLACARFISCVLSDAFACERPDLLHGGPSGTAGGSAPFAPESGDLRIQPRLTPFAQGFSPKRCSHLWGPKPERRLPSLLLKSSSYPGAPIARWPRGASI